MAKIFFFKLPPGYGRVGIPCFADTPQRILTTMTTPLPDITWIAPQDLINAIDPHIATVDITRATWLITRATRDIATVATLPLTPTPGQAAAVRDAIVAYSEWYESTGGGTDAGLRIGHVELPDTNASSSRTVALPAAVYGFLRTAGLLRVTRAVAY